MSTYQNEFVTIIYKDSMRVFSITPSYYSAENLKNISRLVITGSGFSSNYIYHAKISCGNSYIILNSIVNNNDLVIELSAPESLSVIPPKAFISACQYTSLIITIFANRTIFIDNINFNRLGDIKEIIYDPIVMSISNNKLIGSQDKEVLYNITIKGSNLSKVISYCRVNLTNKGGIALISKNLLIDSNGIICQFSSQSNYAGIGSIQEAIRQACVINSELSLLSPCDNVPASLDLLSANINYKLTSINLTFIYVNFQNLSLNLWRHQNMVSL